MKSSRSLGLVAACAALIAPAAYAQCSGWALSAAGGPSIRSSHAMVFDTTRNRAVLFGGFGPKADGTEFLGDTWEFDGTTWSQRSTTGPAGRQNPAMAFDSGRGRVVLFGGYSHASGPVTYGQTHEWNGSAWTSVSSSGPSARYLHAMAYDAARSRTVLFGGIADGVFRDTGTWVWNGSAWTQAATTGPATRFGHAMAYDAARQRVVLFGGFGGAGTNKALLNDTWEWNGTGWTQMASSGPTKRQNHAMAYDASRGKVVLLGGRDANGATLDDSYEWNGSSWTQITGAGPGERESTAMAFDTARQKMVVMGGFSDTGRYGDTWERSNGSGNAPTITSGPSSQTVSLGQTLSLSVQAGGSGPFTYQWIRNGSNLSNGGRVSGATSATLQITGLTAGDMGTYSVRVTNACGSTTSPGATISTSGGGCPADLANSSGQAGSDGAVDVNDLLFFITRFESGNQAADLSNGSGTNVPDGGVDINDLLFFLARFEQGC